MYQIGAIVMKKEIHAGLPSLLSTDSLSFFTDSLSLLHTRYRSVFLSPNVISFAPSLHRMISFCRSALPAQARAHVEYMNVLLAAPEAARLTLFSYPPNQRRALYSVLGLSWAAHCLSR
jgi:hypothetical protein